MNTLQIVELVLVAISNLQQVALLLNELGILAISSRLEKVLIVVLCVSTIVRDILDTFEQS